MLEVWSSSGGGKRKRDGWYPVRIVHIEPKILRVIAAEEEESKWYRPVRRSPEVTVQFPDGETQTVNVEHDRAFVREWDPISHELYRQVLQHVPLWQKHMHDQEAQASDKNKWIRLYRERRMWNDVIEPLFMPLLSGAADVKPIPSLGLRPAGDTVGAAVVPGGSSAVIVTSLYPCGVTAEQKQRLLTTKLNLPFGAMDFLDQSLCRLARVLDVDTIVLQREQGEYRAVTEILDARTDTETVQTIELVHAPLGPTTSRREDAKTRFRQSDRLARTPSSSSSSASSPSTLALVSTDQLSEKSREIVGMATHVLTASPMPAAMATASPAATNARAAAEAMTKTHENRPTEDHPWYRPQVRTCPTVWFTEDGLLRPVVSHVSKGRHPARARRIFKESTSNLAHAWSTVAVPANVVADYPYPSFS